jgi:hypothetical protein
LISTKLKNYEYSIFGTLIATVIAISAVLPHTYAQSSNITNTGCIHGSALGLVCIINQGTHHLPIGKWHAEVNGVNATLFISSVDKSGRINGTLAGGNATCAIGGKPCEINGTFNDNTGRISFLAVSTYHSKPPAAVFVSPVQNYTGFESEKIMPDNETWQIHGIGKTIKPFIGSEFGWFAKMFCGFAGCID